MAVKIRLTRMGVKKKPFYRIVAVDERKKRDGKYLEKLGFLNLFGKENQENLRLERFRILDWLRKGAQPTLVVKKILTKEKIWEEFMKDKVKTLSDEQKKKKKKNRRKNMHPVSEIAERNKKKEEAEKRNKSVAKKEPEKNKTVEQPVKDTTKEEPSEQSSKTETTVIKDDFNKKENTESKTELDELSSKVTEQDNKIEDVKIESKVEVADDVTEKKLN